MKYVKQEKWFAWYPVKTEFDGWVWLKTVWRTVDEAPEHYLGLLPEVTYSSHRRREEIPQSVFRLMTEEERMKLFLLSSIGLQPDGEGGWVAMMGKKSFDRLIAYEHYLIDKYENRENRTNTKSVHPVPDHYYGR